MLPLSWLSTVTAPPADHWGSGAVAVDGGEVGLNDGLGEGLEPTVPDPLARGVEAGDGRAAHPTTARANTPVTAPMATLDPTVQGIRTSSP